ncbi:MAG: homoserine O-succinyltransferase, partial [Acidimicrobiia bacterium]
MPIVPHSALPAFARLAQEGRDVAGPTSGLPTIRIGLVNLMPDAALAATDRQFIRLLSGFVAEANIEVHPFTLASEHRSSEARSYISSYYTKQPQIEEVGVDALIITGANPTHFELSDEPFWEELTRLIDWAEEDVGSTLCSCLATHAVVEHWGTAKRTRLPQKRWGVYQHELVSDHSLLDGIEPPIEAPHSHHFDLSANQMKDAGVNVVVSGLEAGVHMATSDDGYSYVFFQGHPEYDDISLLKEYKREVLRYQAGDREVYPPMPANYFDNDARGVLEEHRRLVEAARASSSSPPEFPENAAARRWDPVWHAQGRLIYANWLK